MNPGERSRTTANRPNDNGQDVEGKLLNPRQYRLKGPFGWSITHQLIWMHLTGGLPPRVILGRHLRPLKSTATPSEADLANVTIPLTGKELLTVIDMFSCSIVLLTHV